ncbi:MAG: hypothetical protein HC819_09675 [Cyclobacteriaceae bacterium]|nr:hypothetical protein [Cyclobacteriaceae bacterium]
MKQYMKIGGLGLFIFGFSAFIISLTLSDYILTEKVIESQGKGEKYDALRMATRSMQNKEYTSNVSFVHDLKSAIDKANSAIVDRYALAPDLAAKIATRSAVNGKYIFDPKTIDEEISASDEVATEKIKALKDYTGWIEGLSFASQEELENKLGNAISSYNNSLSYQRAFDDYASKSVLFPSPRHRARGYCSANMHYGFL